MFQCLDEASLPYTVVTIDLNRDSLDPKTFFNYTVRPRLSVYLKVPSHSNVSGL